MLHFSEMVFSTSSIPCDYLRNGLMAFTTNIVNASLLYFGWRSLLDRDLVYLDILKLKFFIQYPLIPPSPEGSRFFELPYP